MKKLWYALLAMTVTSAAAASDVPRRLFDLGRDPEADRIVQRVEKIDARHRLADFGKQWEQSVKSGTPLVVYVRTAAWHLKGVIEHSTASYEGVSGAGVVVCYPHGGSLYGVKLPGWASEADIRRTIDELRRGHNPPPTPPAQYVPRVRYAPMSVPQFFGGGGGC